MRYDYIILGAGIYGLYAARLLGRRGLKVLVAEYEEAPFKRASWINQARVHNGYHYPRSVSTARTTAMYYHRFNEEFSFAINRSFKKIYAISAVNSLCNAAQFRKFCEYVGIPAVEMNAGLYFNRQYVEAAFETEEFAFDPFMIRDFLMEGVKATGRAEFLFNARLSGIEKKDGLYSLSFDGGGARADAPAVLNATYASVNQLLARFGFEPMKIKYEICEVIMVDVDTRLLHAGLTVMDGQFFSVMPFGLTGKHSLTSVAFTPHLVSYDALPHFACQGGNPLCTPAQLADCNTCPAKPRTAFPYMKQLAGKYLGDGISMRYDSSLFAIKPILLAAELDDSRPTMVMKLSGEPSFTSVLSGKINTVYDLDEALA